MCTVNVLDLAQLSKNLYKKIVEKVISISVIHLKLFVYDLNLSSNCIFN